MPKSPDTSHHFHPATCHRREEKYHIEVVDQCNHFLAYLSPEIVKRQQLFHRATALLIFLEDGKLLLQKKRAPTWKHDLWSVPYTRLITPFEAQYNTALRLFTASMSTDTPYVFPKETISLSSEFGPIFLTLFSSPKTGSMPLDQSCLTVDAVELDGLVREFPEILSPILHQLWLHGLRPLMG